MFSKDQSAQLKQSFWTTFGQYIAPHQSAEGMRINWVNYKTGIKYLNFKMHVDKKSAYIAIEMSHPDPGMQELIFEEFAAFKNMLHTSLEEEWDWELHTTDENYKTVSRIVKTLSDVSIFKESDWPQLISFLKPRLIALDEFWCDAKDGFDTFK
ncbi:DUF4268 domain-containing protein [Pedobacter gandavensis]|uniref:DUF4268 domain-containing protein n=1 Tax=Pedobacter gandavensis TaxID=2679963 RepID=A0ABR6EQZ8_9SPHI|nr:DUF4268 domain-containing protein [Pedobacter gandavensis]MBB2147680.1 DUF4268 domain-containing protein [Pedobacter gandavensis]